MKKPTMGGPAKGSAGWHYNRHLDEHQLDHRRPRPPPMPRTDSNVIRRTMLPPNTCDAACRKKTKQYRDLLNDYLTCIGKDWGMDSLRLKCNGICSFQYKQFVIVIEVPVESMCFFLYTCILFLDTSSSSTSSSAWATAVMRRALELNYLTQETRGCTLGFDPTTNDDKGEALELTLSYSQPILGLAKGEFCNIVVNFLSTAEQLQRKLSELQEEGEIPSRSSSKSTSSCFSSNESNSPIMAVRAPSLPPPVSLENTTRSSPKARPLRPPMTQRTLSPDIPSISSKKSRSFFFSSRDSCSSMLMALPVPATVSLEQEPSPIPFPPTKPLDHPTFSPGISRISSRNSNNSCFSFTEFSPSEEEAPGSPMACRPKISMMGRPTSSPGIVRSYLPRFSEVSAARTSCGNSSGDDTTSPYGAGVHEAESHPTAHEADYRFPLSPPAVYRTRHRDMVAVTGQVRLQRLLVGLPMEESSRSCRRPQSSPLQKSPWWKPARGSFLPGTHTTKHRRRPSVSSGFSFFFGRDK